MPPPTTVTDLVYPDWTNLVDNWRDTDAEWLRNRSVAIFADAAGRTAGLAAPQKGGMSSLQSGTGAPDFWTGSAWESVRYPNLDVTSDAGSVTLRRTGAGAGVQMLSDGSVNISKEFVGVGGVGSTQDNTGIAVKIGAKTVKLATDATSLTIDSPVNVTGAITASGTISAPTLIVPNITSSGTVAAAAITAASVAATGVVTGASVTGGDVILGVTGVYGTVKHRSGGTAQVGVGSDSTVKIDGSALTLNPPVTAASTLTVTGTTSFVGRPSLNLAGTIATWVAGILPVSGNIAPTQNCPDGTLYVTY